jgi:biotin transporter BioY
MKFLAIPSGLSIVLFCAMTLPVIASVFGGIVYVGFGFICAFMIPLFVLGMAALKKKLKIFPSKAVLSSILQQEGVVLKDRMGRSTL